MAAFLFGLQRFCASLVDTSEVSVTDEKAKWVNPNRTTVSAKVSKLDLRCDPSGDAPPVKPSPDTYKPIPLYAVSGSIEKQMMSLIKRAELPACAAYTLSDDSDTEYDFEPFLDNVNDFARKFKMDRQNNGTLDNFVNFMKVEMNEHYADTLFTETLEQSASGMWFYQRQGRLTASKVYDCLHFTGRSTDSYLVRSILGICNDTNINIPALAYGRKHESTARKAYVKIMQDTHESFTCDLSGLVVNQDDPFIGASPDGLVHCTCCGDGCLEIKCPFKYTNENPTTAASLDTKNFTLINEKVAMKRDASSPYYTQIQCQLAATGRKWCDFVLYTRQGLYYERVDFNETFWTSTVVKLRSFYSDYILPKLLQ